MADLNNLIITATTANSWIHPNIKNWAENTDALVEDAINCAEAGASILHIHLPPNSEQEVVKRVREKTEAVIQCGMSSFPIEDRETHFNSGSDMLSIILNHHAEEFTDVTVDQLHPLKELEAYGNKCKKFNIKPEWEVWNTGSFWNLKYLIENSFIEAPHVLTFFFNWPGGTWSPADVESYLYRLKYMPDNCVHTVSVMGMPQLKLLPFVIIDGGNIRVGTEDNPFIKPGKPAKDNADIVTKWVNISKSLGREIADVSETKKMLGL